ncbi:type I polyketide synthase [Lysinibacillus sp. NPDC093216]|uniref:type I polyketide synthase n=1 Tax=Lysinibacillus sp. NPDC093216 TaxID=3390576 RepID=UPI003D0441C7
MEKNLKYSKQNILTYLVDLIEDILDLNISHSDEPFTDLGLASIDIPLFIEKVSKRFGINIQVSSLFEYPNINEYTDYLFNELNKEETTVKNFLDSDLNATDKDSIAIVGVSCRFPAGGNSPEEFWDILMNGKDGISNMPEERWDIEKFYSPDKGEPGKLYTKKGGFLNIPIEQFDAKFFNISPKEAYALDPQQRMLLELTWEAFENSGINIGNYFGSNTGVYVGIAGEEYSFAHYKSGDLRKIDAYSLTGTTFSTACGRISYTFGFEGPSMVLDTACSSSLTALHVACKALEAGEVDTAVVAAANLMISPAVHVCFSKLEAISVDGRSKSFDASANGYGRGEGAGVIILKRLKDAEKNDDNILGVVRGTAVNQDGKSNGLTAPNGLAQEKVIKKALNDARLNESDIDYIEMHGTGTKLGDPIEVKAVVETYGKNRTKENPLKIGSVKSNIGHLEAAAGMASIIKVLLSFKNDVIPGNLYFENPNPFIQWDKSPVKVVESNSDWKSEGKIRRVGINGFGFGGSNAHIIIEEPPKIKTVIKNSSDPIYILKLSAKSERSLQDNIRNYLNYMKSDSVNIKDVVYTNNISRFDFDYRFTVSGRTKKEIMNRMEAYLINGNKIGISTNINEPIKFKKETEVVFLFTGQGSQYVGMGKELYDNNPTFREVFDECDKLFKPFLLKSLVDLIYSGKCTNEEVEKTLYAQPLIFTIEYSVCKMWEKIGVKPSVVLGHSIGEYAAAVVAGIMNLNDAVKLVAIRGRLMDSAPGEGAMLSIYANENTVNKLIEKYDDALSLAIYNAENNIVVSGEKNAIEELAKEAERQKIKVARLYVSHAFHSNLMIPILEDFKEIASQVKFNQSSVNYISSTFARAIGEEEILDANYWTNHIKEKVDFYHSITSIKDAEDKVFLEVGANKTLCALSKLSLRGEIKLLNSLDMKKSDWEQISYSLGELYCSGVKVLWDKFETNINKTYNRVQLPTYSFERKPYWMEPVCSHEKKLPDQIRNDYHPIIGQRFSTPQLKNSLVYQNSFTMNSPYFMKEHIIFDTAISPAAAHMSMLVSIIEDYYKSSVCIIENVEFHSPLIASKGDERTVQILIEDIHEERKKFQIISKDSKAEHGDWSTHCQGSLTVIKDETSEKKINIDDLKNMFPEDLSGFNIYDVMSKFGFNLGEGFKRIKRVWRGESEGVCLIDPKIEIPNKESYTLYPGLIDSIFQSVFAVSELSRKMNSEKTTDVLKTTIPISLGKIKYYYKDAESYWCHVKVNNDQKEGVIGDIAVYNEKGEIVFEIENIMAKLTDRKSLLKELNYSGDQMLYNVEWVEKSFGNIEFENNEKFIIFSNNNEICNKIYDKLSLLGMDSIKVLSGKNFMELDDNTYCISDNEKEDFYTLFKDIVYKFDNEKFNILFISESNEESINQITLETLKEKTACSQLLHLVQAITDLNLVEKMNLKVITNNVHDLDNSPISIYQSTLWGFSQVIRLEFNPLWGGIIDVDSSMINKEIDDVIIKEIITNDEKQVCLRNNNKRYVSRLVKNTYSKKKHKNLDIAIKSEATYLITGGTGSIGMLYSEYLIEKGARNLVLLSRNKPKGDILDKVKSWEERGIKVLICQVDVSKESDISALISDITMNFPEIKGVVHAAGILDDRLIRDQTWESFEQMFMSKVFGTYNLHHSLRNCELDFFVMMSSIASVIGNIGQANYATANYFMNIFAQYRRKLNLPAISICWGPWSEIGMASRNEENMKRIEKQGIYSISTELGMKMIDKLLNENHSSILVADMNWDLYNENTKLEEMTTFLSKLINLDDVTNRKKDKTNSEANILSVLRSLKFSERYDYLQEKLKNIAATLMGFDDASLLVLDQSLTEQGADSLMIFSMRNEINKLTSKELDISVFFNYPSLKELNDYLLMEVLSFEEETSENDINNDGLNTSETIDDLLAEIESLVD